MMSGTRVGVSAQATIHKTWVQIIQTEENFSANWLKYFSACRQTEYRWAADVGF